MENQKTIKTKQMKHTPGPWYVKFMHEDDPDSDFWVKSDVNPKVHYGTDIMCDDYGEHNGYPREQRLADAKLIAAAPDLLESLKHLMANRRFIKTITESHSDSLLRKSFDNCLNAIKKAIE